MDMDNSISVTSGNRRSPTGGNDSSNDILFSSQSDLYSADRYNSSKRRKEKRKSKRTSSIKKFSTDATARVPPRYSTSGESLGSVTDYAFSKYVETPVPVTPESEQTDAAASTNQEINALLNTGNSSAMFGDDDDPLAFRDEFEDEMDEIEMREEKRRNFDRFGDTEMSKREKLTRQFKLYFVPLLLFLLFLVGIAAGILYFAGFGESDKAAVQKYLQAVPEAPKTLKLMCEATVLNTPNTFQVPALCEDSCSKAECCWNPDGPYACTTDTKNQCPPYVDECSQHKDHIASTIPPNPPPGQVVPAFPSDLRDTCKPTGLEPSAKCLVGCAHANCCWDKTTTNNKNNVQCTDDSNSCGDYKDVCDFLNDLDSASTGGSGSGIGKEWPFPDAPQGLSVYCDPSEMEEISLHICQDRCAEAECCWKDDVDSCVSTYPVQACHDYTQACSILNDLATAAGNSHDTTSETAPSGATSSTAANIPEPPSNLSEICDNEKITNSEIGGEALVQCEKICLTASCCWQPNSDNPCTGDEKCTPYNEVCQLFAKLFAKPDDYNPNAETLPPIVSQVPEAASNIATTCSADVLKPSVENGRFIVECEKECLRGACCWKQNHPTVCPDSDECSAYMEPCADNLVAALLSLQGGDEGDDNTSLVPEAASDIAITCNPENLKTTVENGKFLVQCEKECLAGACCWKENSPNPCPNDSMCSAYKEPCGTNLVEALTVLESALQESEGASAVVPQAASNIDSICSPGNLKATVENGKFLVECEKECLAGACCWKENDPNPCPNAPECSAYMEPCGTNLVDALVKLEYDSSPVLTEAAADIDQVCSLDVLKPSIEDGKFIVECEKICLAGACCWKENSPNPCPDAPECSAYMVPCATNLVDALLKLEYNGPPVVPEAAADIDQVCNADILKADSKGGEMIVACEKECLAGACCWKEDTPTPCPDAPECSAYVQPCGTNLLEALLFIENGGNEVNHVSAPAPTPMVQNNVPEAASDIDMTCDPEVLKLSVSNGEFIVECEKKCLSAACCWKENHSTICPDAPECSDYDEPCKKNLLTALELLNSQDHTLDIQSIVPPDPPSDLSQICSQTNIIDMQGLEKCREECSSASCCWEIGSASCSSNNNCQTFKTECELMRKELNLDGNNRRMLRHV